MKLTEKQGSGITTLGATGVALLILVATDFINNWWLIASIMLIIMAIGEERK